MSFSSNCIINIYSMMILIIVYYQSINNPEKEFLNHKLFRGMIKMTFVMLAVDTLSRFDGRPDTIYYFINHSANFAMFALSPILPSIWILYVHYQIFQEKTKIKRLVYPLLLINLLNLSMVIASQYYGWYYYIDSGNIYHRGEIYWVCSGITVVLLIMSYILIFVNRKEIIEKHYLSLVFFAIPPFLSIILQSFFYGISIILNSIVLSIIVVLLNIQNQSIYIDHLTGLNNRKKIEVYLKTKISLSTKEKTFSAIMIDLDGFKTINDVYGHDMGDHALKASANLLKDCIRSKDFIGRFGGDEFTIILDLCNRSEIEEIISRIKSRFIEYNKSGEQPYKLSASMGYDVYNYDLEMTVEEFEKHIDKLMYKNKQLLKKQID